MLGHRRLTTFLAAAVVADTIPTMLNSAKLSLATNWPVGPTGRVKVSDGFVVSGAGTSSNGFYYESGTLNGKAFYLFSTANRADAIDNARLSVFWDGANWNVNDSTGTPIYNSTDDVLTPLLVTTWQDVGFGSPTLTHPAVQQLQSPSSSQGGVFVSGGTQDGVWLKGAPINGKSEFYLLGTVSGSNEEELIWRPNINDDFGVGPSAAGWTISNLSDLSYYSLSDVLTPDLASNWKNASDDSPASITVTSVTQGELDAGVTVAGAGDATANRTLPFSLNENGNRAWGLNGADSVNTDGSVWSTSGNTGAYSAPYNAASPWNAAPWTASAGAPAPTVTRNNVASEANWSNV